MWQLVLTLEASNLSKPWIRINKPLCQDWAIRGNSQNMLLIFLTDCPQIVCSLTRGNSNQHCWQILLYQPATNIYTEYIEDNIQKIVVISPAGGNGPSLSDIWYLRQSNLNLTENKGWRGSPVAKCVCTQSSLSTESDWSYPDQTIWEPRLCVGWVRLSEIQK